MKRLGEKMESQNVWICLYVLSKVNNRENANFLLYGYAVDVEKISLESWQKYVLHSCKVNSVNLKLYRITSVLNYEDAKTFAANWEKENQTIEINGEKIEIRAQLRSSPPIYIPPKHSSLLGPESLTDQQLLKCATWWRLDKFTFLHSIIPLSSDKFESVIGKLLECLHEGIGFDFKNKSAHRIGNFEWFHYPFGGYYTPPGISWEVEKDEGKTVKVFIEPPAADEYTSLTIECICYSGNKEVIIDQIKHWEKQSNPIEFTSTQPISCVELKVWGSKSHHLIFWDRPWLIREINIDMEILSQRRKIIDPWYRRLENRGTKEEKLSKIRDIQTVSSEKILIGGYKEDPWVPSSRQAKEEISGLFPKEGKALWIPKGEEIEAFDSVRKLFDKNGITRAVIVDPFFSREAAEHLLPRIEHTEMELYIITSLIKDINPDKGPEKVKGYDPIKEIQKFCQKYYRILPQNLKILNIIKATNKQAFHDRYLLIWQADKSFPDAFLLSNSLNSWSRKFPLVVSPLELKVVKEVEEYIIRLCQGEVGKIQEAWSPRKWEEFLKKKKREKLPLGLTYFPNWKVIFSIFEISIFSNDNDEDILREAIKKGILTFDKVSNKASWRVPKENRKKVVSKLVNQLKKSLKREQKSDTHNLLSALGYWWYYGSGIEPQDIVIQFEKKEINWVVEGIKEYLRDPKILPQNSEKSERETFLQQSWQKGFKWERKTLELADVLLKYGLEPGRVLHPETEFPFRLLILLAPEEGTRLIEKTRNLQYLSPFLEEIHEPTCSKVRDKILNASLKSQDTLLQSIAIQALWKNLISQPPYYSQLPQAKEVQELLNKLIACKVPPENYLIVLSYWISSFLVRETTLNSLKPLTTILIEKLPQEGLPEDVLQNVITTLSGRLPDDNNNYLRFLGNELKKKNKCPKDANCIHQEIINRIMKRLPLKGKPKKTEKPESFYQPRDFSLTLEAAYAVWDIYKSKTIDWYRNEILQQLRTRDLKEPFLRDKNYEKWSELGLGLVWGLWFGAKIITVGDERGEKGLDKAALEITKKFVEELCPLIWMWDDFYTLLPNLLLYLSSWTDRPSVGEKIESLLKNAIQHPAIPSWQKLWIYILAENLTKKHINEIKELAESPRTEEKISLIPEYRLPIKISIVENLCLRIKKAEPSLKEQLSNIAESTIKNWFKETLHLQYTKSFLSYCQGQEEKWKTVEEIGNRIGGIGFQILKNSLSTDNQ